MIQTNPAKSLTKYFPTGRKMFLLLFVIDVVMHFNHFNKDLMSFHVWRQTQTQSNIDNFYEEDMNILNPRKNDRGEGNGIFRMEFALMQWLVACLYKVFGQHLIITRIVMFIISFFTLIGLYRLIRSLTGNETGASMGVWALNFSPTFFYYSINPLPDNLALCLGTWGLVTFIVAQQSEKKAQYLLSGLLLSLSTLCKLPFVLYYALPFIVLMNELYKRGLNRLTLLKGICVLAGIVLPAAWYISVIPQWKGNGIVQGVTDNQATFSQVLDYLQHNLLSTLPELLLNYGSVLFFVVGLYFIVKKKIYKHCFFTAFVFLGVAVVGYFLFEINMIVKVHDYYLFPFIPLLFLIVACGAMNLWQKNSYTRSVALFLLLVLPFTAYARLKNRWNPDEPGLNKDLFTYKQELQRAVPKGKLCIAGSDDTHFVWFYYLGKKGWIFDQTNHKSMPVEAYIKKGACYLYSDSRDFEKRVDVAIHLDSLILEKGSIKVYRLK